MKLGIIQGRLSPPEDNHIQEFPIHWEKEFALLQVLGLSHIEWIVTKGSWEYNPMLDDTVDLKGLPISSICVDAMIDKDFYKDQYISYIMCNKQYFLLLNVFFVYVYSK